MRGKDEWGDIAGPGQDLGPRRGSVEWGGSSALGIR